MVYFNENGPFFYKNGPFLVEIGAFLVEIGSFLVENGPFLIENDPISSQQVVNKNAPISVQIHPSFNFFVFQRYLEQNGQLDFESIWKDEIGRDCIKENVFKISPTWSVVPSGLLSGPEIPGSDAAGFPMTGYMR